MTLVRAVKMLASRVKGLLEEPEQEAEQEAAAEVDQGDKHQTKVRIM